MAEPVIQRGAIVVCVLPGDYGKPRPAVVVQSDLFNATHASVTVCPLTSELADAPLFRVRVEAGKQTGLAHLSEVMVDKITSIRRSRIAEVVGSLSVADRERLDAALGLWLELEPADA